MPQSRDKTYQVENAGDTKYLHNSFALKEIKT